MRQKYILIKTSVEAMFKLVVEWFNQKYENVLEN